MSAVNPATLLAAIIILVLFGEKPRNKISKWFNSKLKIWCIPAAILTTYCLLAGFSGSWTAIQFIKLSAYFSIPTLLLQLAGQNRKHGSLFDIAAILALWLPFELKLITKSWFDGGFGYHLTAASAVIYAFLIFTGWRNMNIQARWKINAHDIAYVLLFFLISASIIIPIGNSVGFLKFKPIDYFHTGQWMIPLIFLGIFLGTAIPEELLFRGLLQNSLTKRLSYTPALILTSVIFGFAHLTNTVTTNVNRFEFPNWTYVFFATIAGLCYGALFHKRRSLLAAVLLHTLVDSVWVILLRG